MMVSKIILILLVVSGLVHKPTSIPSRGERPADGYIQVALAAMVPAVIQRGKNPPMFVASISRSSSGNAIRRGGRIVWDPSASRR
jgi:hypothetical protein